MPSSGASATRAARIAGTNRADRLAALDEGDKVFGLSGNEVLTSQFTRSQLSGGRGRDQLTTEVTLTATRTNRSGPSPRSMAARARTGFRR